MCVENAASACQSRGNPECIERRDNLVEAEGRVV